MCRALLSGGGTELHTLDPVLALAHVDCLMLGVREALPAAEHLELDCGHVPQLERPRDLHGALSRFLAG